eukprot:Blabericola_migrator_1__2928@NODE_1841_length_3692_cov_288_665655_g1178_i0_p4_GENE_NODE_1841_length_3692_cov_288_665655_g1178_i0NODE_1841_length_3692_cov_288_665655_g1178_i0_p4_ORF_typecomplete_len112_score13_30_NODE_1841_length_3692_cov_288_665655_g1178_i0470805
MTIVPYMTASIEESIMAGGMTPVGEQSIPVTSLKSSIFVFMNVTSNWHSDQLDLSMALSQCEEGFLPFEGYISEIIYYTVGGRAGDRTSRTWPFRVPCMIVTLPSENDQPT